MYRITSLQLSERHAKRGDDLIKQLFISQQHWPPKKFHGRYFGSLQRGQ